MLVFFQLILSDNLLTSFPYEQVAPLKVLRTLDLSHNEIIEVLPQTGPTPEVQLNLDTLHLEFNQIEIIPTASFKLFQNLNRTFLDGNGIHTIDDDAFRNARIKELYMRHCGLATVSPLAFGGLENTLQVLDLSGNKISNTSEKLFKNFDLLRLVFPAIHGQIHLVCLNGRRRQNRYNPLLSMLQVIESEQ